LIKEGFQFFGTARVSQFSRRLRLDLTDTFTRNIELPVCPASKLRAWVTPSQRGKGNQIRVADETQAQPPAERRAAMTWAQRLKRVFSIDIETCSACGGAVKVIACIDDPAVIQKILSHLQGKVAPQPPDLLPTARAPPGSG